VTGVTDATGVPDLAGDLDLAGDPELAHAADVLARALVRFHPSFRFEERLAARLREAASPQPRRIIPFPALPVAGGSMPFALDLAPAAVGQAVGRLPRPVLVGGAIASGVSIAGAAVVAWRIAAWRRPRRDA
jgi:hypothetical protein